MIIHHPEIKTEGKSIIVSARIETKASVSIPQELWFEYPLEYQYAVNDRSDSFFVSLFLLGMHLNEDIEVRGEVSPKLAGNSREISSNYLQYAPKHLRRVDFNFRTEKATQPDRNRKMRLSSFSGGVDSFYSFWSHFHPEKSAHPTNLTHGLFIHGYDLVLENKEYYERFLLEYQQLFDIWGLSLIQCSTNAYSFYQYRTPWIFSNTPTLIGSVLGLSKGVSYFSQPGNQESNLTNPIMPDSYISLFSTETTDFHPHAIDFDRSDKFNFIYEWPPLQKHMRICMDMNTDTEGVGCQKCVKCLNTSLLLYLKDIQEKFPNYNEKITWLKFIHFCWINLDISTYPKREYFKLIYAKKRYDLIVLFWLMYPFNYINVLFHRKLIPTLPKKLVYFVKNLVYRKREKA